MIPDYLDVIAVDPGKLSGLVLVRTPLAGVSTGIPYKLVSEELEQFELCDRVVELLSEAERNQIPTVLVVEDFAITSKTASNTKATWSLEILGTLRYLTHKVSVRVPFVTQTPAQAKAMISNEALKKTDLWHRGGAGHANDAARHALHYLVVHGLITAEALIPEVPR